MNLKKLHRHCLPVFLLYFLFASSCNSIDKKDLKIIDDIQLGTTIAEFDSIAPALHIERESFLASIFS